MTRYYSFVQNEQCEFFPCHEGIPREEFNCLFCYCPLYSLSEQCGGTPTFRDNGVKDCSQCNRPHGRGGYPFVQKRIHPVVEKAKRR